jgi:hypothetical protein
MDHPGDWHLKDFQIERFALKGSSVGLNSRMKIGHDMDCFSVICLFFV